MINPNQVVKPQPPTKKDNKVTKKAMESATKKDKTNKQVEPKMCCLHHRPLLPGNIINYPEDEKSFNASNISSISKFDISKVNKPMCKTLCQMKTPLFNWLRKHSVPILGSYKQREIYIKKFYIKLWRYGGEERGLDIKKIKYLLVLEQWESGDRNFKYEMKNEEDYEEEISYCIRTYNIDEKRLYLTGGNCPCSMEIVWHCLILNKLTKSAAYIGNDCIKYFTHNINFLASYNLNKYIIGYKNKINKIIKDSFKKDIQLKSTIVEIRKDLIKYFVKINKKSLDYCHKNSIISDKELKYLQQLPNLKKNNKINLKKKQLIKFCKLNSKCLESYNERKYPNFSIDWKEFIIDLLKNNQLDIEYNCKVFEEIGCNSEGEPNPNPEPSIKTNPNLYGIVHNKSSESYNWEINGKIIQCKRCAEEYELYKKHYDIESLQFSFMCKDCSLIDISNRYPHKHFEFISRKRNGECEYSVTSKLRKSDLKKTIINFGKHNGDSLYEIIKDDKNYCNWIVREYEKKDSKYFNNFSPDQRKLVKNIYIYFCG